LFLVDVERDLKLLVQDVNHPIAKAPQQKQRGDQRKGDEEISAIRQAEQAAAFARSLARIGWCNHNFVFDETPRVRLGADFLCYYLNCAFASSIP
jgi:hypothetical protein